QRLAATDREEENAGVRQLVEDIFDLGGAHLAVAGVVEVAMFAALVAPVRDVEMHAQRNAVKQGSLIQLGHQAPWGLRALHNRLDGLRRLVGNVKNAKASKIFYELQCIVVGLFRLDFELGADVLIDNFRQPRLAVGGSPDRRGGLVEAEQ